MPYSSDPYFSIWRLAWVGHAIVTNPGELFHANIFYPAPSTLGYSDAMLLPGIVTAPFFWASPVTSNTDALDPSSIAATPNIAPTVTTPVPPTPARSTL